MQRVGLVRARLELSQLVASAKAGERVLLTYRDKPMAGMVSPEDFRVLSVMSDAERSTFVSRVEGCR